MTKPTERDARWYAVRIGALEDAASILHRLGRAKLAADVATEASLLRSERMARGI